MIPCQKETSLFDSWSSKETFLLLSAEIDYVLQHGSKVVPIEVKAGSTGGLKSLHLFMELKKLSLAVRVNSDLLNKTDIKIKSRQDGFIEYQLLSIPFYLVGQIYRLLDSLVP
ncbi:hypothetical protein BH10PSE19_BH10PSE19_15320 [soil metagenome]